MIGYELPLTLEEKIEQERPINEFEYDSTLDWRYMKKVKSDTNVRGWHFKVEEANYRVIQVRIPKLGEILYAYIATNTGNTAVDKPLFEKTGIDWFHGLEYLLRLLEGENISKLRLDKTESSCMT